MKNRFKQGKRLKKFQILKKKIEKLISDGRFYRLTTNRKNSLLKKFNNLRNALLVEKAYLKYATGTIAFFAATSTMNGQSFTPNQNNNPLPSAFFAGNAARPVFVDIDQDGNKDIVAGTNEGNISFLKNLGDGNFELKTGNANPFNEIDYSDGVDAAFADIDGDNNKDLILVTSTAGIYTYINTNGAFELASDENNPFKDISLGSGEFGGTTPFVASADWDNDGDDDVFFGDKSGIQYFQNEDSSYTQVTDNNPFADVTAEYDFDFTDHDDDGDLDLFMGSKTSMLTYYENNDGTFERSASTLLPPIIKSSGSLVPSFGDVNDDGKIDAIFGQSSGYYIYYQNNEASFELVKTPDSPIGNGFTLLEEINLTFADIDEDGDQDAIVGGEGGLQWFENSGTSFTEADEKLPFTDTTAKCSNKSASFIDLDKDGDLDAFVACEDTISYLINTGMEFKESTYPGEAFKDIRNDGSPMKITFFDIDKDADLDAFIPLQTGEISYFKNNAGTFVPVGSDENPLSEITTEGNKIEFFDLDSDGDTDVLLSTNSGTIAAFENTGNNEFISNDNSNFNPFTFIEENDPVYLTITDYNKDGKPEAFIGGNKKVLFYTSDAIPTGFKSNATSLNFNVYPNPSNEIVHINTHNDEVVNYELINLQGISVMKGTGTQLKVSGLSKGMYLIKVETDEISGIQSLNVE